MKLFLATNSDTIKTVNKDLLENTIKTALLNTDFDIFLIFDGKKEELNLPSFNGKNVTIIEHRHRCYDRFMKSPKLLNDVWFKQIVTGAFLRTEIPFLCEKYNFNDKYVLYTDYDVLFLKKDYSDLDNIKPKHFAACPETNINDWDYFNTGSMLMNVEYLKTQDEFILNYIEENFDDLSVVDQTLYNNIYKNKIDRLPVEYNWKTYWGINKNAKIIHFHGLKPRYMESEERRNLPELKPLRDMNPASYEHYNDLFEMYKSIEL